jgi:Secretion system C-terminal sorting domain
MKKSLLTFTGLAALTAVNAQTTITTADLPALLTVIHQTRDTSMTQSPGASGIGQTYNFTALLDQQEDSTTFTNPMWTPYGTAFPQANMALMINQGDTYLYAENTGTELLIHGQAADPFGTGVIALAFTNPETQMTFPAAYGGGFADTAGGTTQFYFGMDPGIGFTVDSVRVHSTIVKYSDYDAWGSAQTPLGTFNVLRQNTWRRQIDTIDIYAFGQWAPNFFSQSDSTRTYSYWTNGIGSPIVELTDQDDLGFITDCRWVKTNPTVTGVPSNENTAVINAYPNPAADVISFSTPTGEGSIELIDVTGRVVKTAVINSDITQMNVSDLAEGSYVWRVNGVSVQTGKLQIAR